MQDQFTQIVAMFLSEVIRSRKTTIRRAAEIARRVVYALPTLKDESHVLSLVSLIEHDFEEMVVLKEALRFGLKPADIEMYEEQIKNFAADLFKEDVVASSQFLQEAARPDATVQRLCIMYPDFCSYVQPVSVDAELAALAARI